MRECFLRTLSQVRRILRELNPGVLPVSWNLRVHKRLEGDLLDEGQRQKATAETVHDGKMRMANHSGELIAVARMRVPVGWVSATDGSHTKDPSPRRACWNDETEEGRNGGFTFGGRR